MINYSLYEFRNVQRQRIFKQNRIILISSRVIEFWCFGLPAALGGGSGPHTCAHACVVNMVISCKWLPPLHLGKSREFPMMSYTCACVHACACTWVGCTLLPPPTSIHLTIQPRGPQTSHHLSKTTQNVPVGQVDVPTRRSM